MSKTLWRIWKINNIQAIAFEIRESHGTPYIISFAWKHAHLKLKIDVSGVFITPSHLFAIEFIHFGRCYCKLNYSWHIFEQLISSNDFLFFREHMLAVWHLSAADFIILVRNRLIKTRINDIYSMISRCSLLNYFPHFSIIFYLQTISMWILTSVILKTFSRLANLQEDQGL